MEQSLLDGWQHGSNQPARTASSTKSPIPNDGARNGVERVSSNPIARKESESERTNETCVASWNPPTSVVG
ncbi:MAG: hypothetical protein IGS39_22240 [Calothrix sp. C42_A2020_038]|nr:hypothetical protein [Calothrix sp. C42_A2020_038]